MASNYWIKVYHELLDDPLTGKLGDRLCWRMMQCFLLAGEQDDDGWLLPTDEIAWRFRMSTEECEADLLELQRHGILEFKDGRWFVVKFAERQAPMTSTERTRRHRKAKAAEDARSRGYADVGSPSDEPPRDEGLGQTRNDVATNRPTDKNRTETDTDTEAEQQPVVGQFIDWGLGEAKAMEIARHPMAERYMRWVQVGLQLGEVNKPDGYIIGCWRNDAADPPAWFDPKLIDDLEFQRSRYLSEGVNH